MKKDKNNNQDGKGKDILVGFLALIAIICIVIITIYGYTLNKKSDDTTIISYTDLIKQISAGNVKKVEMKTGSTSIKVTLNHKIEENEEEKQDDNNTENEEKENTENKIEIFGGTSKDEKVDPELVKKAIVPNTQSFVELIQNKVADGNEIELIQKSPSILSTIPSYFFSLLPTIIMVALFIMIFKMQGLGDRGEVYNETERKTKVKFSDVARLYEEKEEMVELVQFFKDPKKYIEMGERIPK